MNLSKSSYDLIFEAINSSYIYRDSLNLPQNLTFGLEIEYENCNIKFGKFLNSSATSYWNNKGDRSVEFGGEIVSPILTDKKEYWQELKKVCEKLKGNGAEITENAGAHVHIGAHIIGDNYQKWIEFIKLYIYYENIIYRYSFGESICGRKVIKEYAEPFASYLYCKFYSIKKATSLQDVLDKIYTVNRYYAINFNNVDSNNISKTVDKNTIEFRSPNGTINEKIWQNNVKTFASMILAVINNKVDTEYIDYQIKSEEVFFNKNFYYNDIYLKKALEFVDIIFNNNDDKMMFLKQYIKDKTYVKI